MNREDSGFRLARVLAMWVPSMLETNQTRGPPEEYGLRASVTMRGPYEETWHQKTRSKAHERWGQPGPSAGETKALDGTPHSIPRPSSPHQVRAADADVDDICDGFARVPLPVTASDMLVESRRRDQPSPLRVSCCSK